MHLTPLSLSTNQTFSCTGTRKLSGAQRTKLCQKSECPTPLRHSCTFLAGVSSVGTTPLVIRHGESWSAEHFVESLSNYIEPIMNALFLPVIIVTCSTMRLATRHSLPNPGPTRTSCSCSSSPLTLPTYSPKKYLVPREGPGLSNVRHKIWFTSNNFYIRYWQG